MMCRWLNAFSVVDHALLPEVAGDADLGVVVDQGFDAGAAVSPTWFSLIKTGVWVEIFDTECRQWQARHLSWISPVDGRYFFMDLRGVTVAVYRQEEIAALIDSGCLSILEPLRLRASA